MLTVNNRIQVPLRELQFTFARSGGPGGQNVNKLNTKAVLHWRVVDNQTLPEGVKQRFLQRHRRRISNEGDLVLTSQRFRDQGRNVADCLNKLKDLLEEVARPPKPRKKTRPTKASRRRRLQEKRQKSEKKQRRKPPKLE